MFQNPKERTKSFVTDDGVCPSLSGVLTLTINGANKMYAKGRNMANANVYVQISVRTITKRTQIVRAENGAASWKQSFSLPVLILRNRHHPFNWLKLEVLAFDSQEHTQHTVLGSVSFQLHDVIKSVPVASVFDLLDENIYTGEINLGMLFSYGMYGYGASPQLAYDSSAHTLQIDKDAKMEKALRHSLMPRVIPEDGRPCLGPRRLLLPMPCKHPDFIPFKHKINLLNAQTRSESVETSSGREQNHQRPSNVKSDGISGTAGVAGNEQGMSSSPSLYHHKHPTLSPDFSPLTRTPPHSPSLSPLVDPDHYSALSDIEDDDKDGRNAVPFFYLRKRMSRLHDMRNCYINIEKRTDRIKFLHQQLLASAKQEETIYNLGGQKTLSTHRSAGRGGLAAHSRAGYLKHLQPASSNKHKLNEIYQRFKPRAARRKSMIGASFSRPSVANISFSAKRGTDHQSVADRPFAPAQTNQSFRYSSQNDTVNHSVQAPNHHIIPNRSDHDHNFHVSDSEGNMLIDDHDNIDLSLNLHVGDISQPDQQSVLAPPRSSHTQTPAVTIATDSDDNEPRSSSSARGGSANTSAHSLAGEREPLYMKRQSRMNQSRQYSHAATSKGGKVNQLTNAAVVNNNNSNATSLRESAAPLSSVSARAPRRPSVNPLLHLDFITPTPTATVVTAAVPLTATSMKTNP